MQLWKLPDSNNEQGSFDYRTLDSSYFIKAGMSIQKGFEWKKMNNLNLDDGDGLFAVNNLEGGHSEVLIALTCSPKISFFDELVVFDGGEAALRMDVYWEVCSILFLHSQLRLRHTMGRQQ